jgi:hypothetical protein
MEFNFLLYIYVPIEFLYPGINSDKRSYLGVKFFPTDEGSYLGVKILPRNKSSYLVETFIF